MTHPCDGHPCDHCYLCDVVGICCQTVGATAPAVPVAARVDPETALRQAIVAERDFRVDLVALVRAEVQLAHQYRATLPSPAAALPASTVASSPTAETTPQPVLIHLKGGS